VDESRKIRDRLKVDYKEMVKSVYYTSTLELKNIKEALTDEHWIVAMQDELE
jgi:hypothetical protein